LRLRALLDTAASRGKFGVFYPAMEFCTDNGAMFALAGCLRLKAGDETRPGTGSCGFAVKPRWDLASLR